MADIETRCRNAIENLKSYRFDGKISCDDYHEFVSLIGSLPQYVEERNELAKYKRLSETDFVRCS